MFKIKLTAKAKKELRRISKSHKQAIASALEEIKVDPHLGKPLRRELYGKFSYRVGIYRIIYKINKQDMTIHVLTASHRSVVYN